MSHPPTPLRRHVQTGALLLGSTWLATASVAGGSAYAAQHDNGASHHVSVAVPWRNDEDSSDQRGSDGGGSGTAPSSGVPTFVAAGEAGEDSGTNPRLGGLLVAGGLLTFVGGFIASRRRAAAKGLSRVVATGDSLRRRGRPPGAHRSPAPGP